MTKAPATAPGMLPSPPTTAAANTDSMVAVPVSGSIAVSSPISIPPNPASPMPRNVTSRATVRAFMPFSAASDGLSATARIILPVRVKPRNRNSAAIATAAQPAFAACCGPIESRSPAAPNRQSRNTGSS